MMTASYTQTSLKEARILVAHLARLCSCQKVVGSPNFVLSAYYHASVACIVWKLCPSALAVSTKLRFMAKQSSSGFL